VGSKLDINIPYKLERYAISDLDEASDPKYYGFLTEDGTWYLMMNSSNHFRYERGQTLGTYTSAWIGRATETYDYYPTVF
jgi:hypothetical protein